MGPAAAAAVPDLVQALDDKDWVVRWSVARALGAVAVESSANNSVAALSVALQDKDSRVCEAAAFALEQMGVAAQGALPALAMAATGIRNDASAAGEERSCQVIDVGPAIEEVLMDNGWTVRWAAVRALGVIGAGSREALPPLTQALRDEEWQVRGIAALAIGQFGKEATSESMTAVAQLTSDEHAAVRLAAATALGEIGPPARFALASLRSAEQDDDAAVRESASNAIGKILGTL